MQKIKEKDEIVIYKISTPFTETEIQEEVKGIFKKTVEKTEVDITREIIYSLTYRVDEDRFWFSKYIDGEVVDCHHTKNNLSKSISIIKGIKSRLEQLGYEVNLLVDLENDHEELFNSIKEISRDIERERKPNFEPEHYKKQHLQGILLK